MFLRKLIERVIDLRRPEVLEVMFEEALVRQVPWIESPFPVLVVPPRCPDME